MREYVNSLYSTALSLMIVVRIITFTNVHTANQTVLRPAYLASIFLINKLVIPVLRIVEGTIAGDAEVLIGMDIIGKGDFAVTYKGGKTVYSYRYPSCNCIDFVKETEATTVSPALSRKHIGRNDPCPCGSGKKFKKCCGRG